jgi:hypothetical protein
MIILRNLHSMVWRDMGMEMASLGLDMTGTAGPLTGWLSGSNGWVMDYGIDYAAVWGHGWE